MLGPDDIGLSSKLCLPGRAPRSGARDRCLQPKDRRAQSTRAGRRAAVPQARDLHPHRGPALWPSITRSRPGFASQEKSLEVKREAPFPQQSRPMPLELPGLAWPLVGAVILPHWEVTQENSALLQAGAQAARPPPWSCWHPISARLPPDVVPAWPCLALTALSRHTLEAPPDGGPQQPRASCGFSAPLVPHSWGPSHPLFAREPLCAAPASLSLRRPVRPKPSESPIYTQPGLLPPAGLCRYTIVGLQEAPASVSLASPPNGPLRLPDWCTHKTRSCTEMLMAFCCGGKQSGPGDKAPSQALPQRPGPTPSRH
ncbi:uncharacterized protein LOC125091962 isoform X3 [Lutra lutra]|uniref:uncharacterized protein LOC125091962 isoform X3 n=1 Tax=Lutra lutra TaxID=9657 RepID=UPI001FD5B7F5|nr:uncharacterized protein LOC125091962 isoform X3 [Lutra lutra]